MRHKVVHLPIMVPDSDYCWDGLSPCKYFDNEGGHPSCDLGMEGTHGISFKYDKRGNVKKPDYCKTLNDKVMK